MINKAHAREESSGKKRAEYSPLSPLTPLSIVMPEMANADPLAGLLGGNDSETQGQSSTTPAQPKSKRQEKLAKKPKRVMIRG